MADKCPDYLRNLNDYLDGTLDPGICREIDEHVGHCDNCRIMIDTLRQTVKLCRGGQEIPLPKALEDRLGQVLKDRWNKKFGRTE